MLRHPSHDHATSNVLAWSSHAANVESAAEEETVADADEPPDPEAAYPVMSPQFKRASISRPKENHASLLTQALQSCSESESTAENNSIANTSSRRRSITSNFSITSTTDLTSDTGLSTPARTETPSPRLPSIGFVPILADKPHGPTGVQIVGSIPRTPSTVNQNDRTDFASVERTQDPAVVALQKKRCISFACAAKPQRDVPKMASPPAAPAPKPAHLQQRKPCIKFACVAQPKDQTPQRQEESNAQGPAASGSASSEQNSSPSTIPKARSPSALRSTRSSTRRRFQSPDATHKKKLITANSNDLKGDLCRFHEFATDEPQEDDWIRQEKGLSKRRLTIDDTLKMENAIRQLGKEAEEEAEQEEQEEEEEGCDDDPDNSDELDGLDEDDYGLEEDKSGYGSDDDFSDGYNTDEEYGFSDSEADEQGDEGLMLWNTEELGQTQLSDATPICGPSLFDAHESDSSTYSFARTRPRRSRQKPIGIRPVTPELPDSTDFVCGTLDEDRPLEEAYMSHLAARRRENLRPIPQDIDPSFPTSEPEDDDEEESRHSHDSGEHLWLHGELEDLHHDRDRVSRRDRKADNQSPKRYHSPPPKRLHSPPPKIHGRSPRRLFDRSSPKHLRSPLLAVPFTSPRVSPNQAGNEVAFKSLAFRPGLTHTKSLPKASGLFPHAKSNHRRPRAGTLTKDKHVRGAIDIVKGLEQKRQRRKEKFYQKYCSRARKGQIQEKRAPPGEGAQRMRELGLFMAGKTGQGNYVLSI